MGCQRTPCLVVLMNKADIEEHGLREGDEIDLRGATGDGVPRIVRGLRVVTYNVPQGSCVGYYRECNPVLPLWHTRREAMCRRQNPYRSASISATNDLMAG